MFSFDFLKKIFRYVFVSPIIPAILMGVMMMVCGGNLWAEKYYRWHKSGTSTWEDASSWEASDSGIVWSTPSSSPSSSTSGGERIYINTSDVSGNIVITLAQDVDVSVIGTVYIECYDGYTVTIDLNGHNLTVNNLVLGNVSSTKNTPINLVVKGSGTLTAGNITYKSTSTSASVTVTNGASVVCSGDFNSTNSSSNISVVSEGSSSVTVNGTTASGVNIASSYVWSGTTDSSWATGTNWSGGSAPASGVSVKVTIPAGCSNYPEYSSGDLALNGEVIIESGASLNVSAGAFTAGGTLSTGGTITSSGNQTYTGAVTLTGDAVFESSGGNITFSAAISNETSGKALTIKVDDSDKRVYFSADAGSSSVKLGNVTVTGNYEGTSGKTSNIYCDAFKVSKVADVRGSIYASSVEIGEASSLLGACSTIETIGDQTYNGSLLINKDGLIFKGSSITFNGNVVSWPGNGTSTAKAIEITGNAVFNANIGSSSDKLSSVSVSGTTTFGTGSGVTTSGTQTYTGAATLSADVVLTAVNSTVTFSDTVTGSSNTLTFGSASTATNVIFTKAVSVSALTVYGTSTIYGNLTSSGNQDYEGAVTLGAESTFTGNTVILNGNVSGKKLSVAADIQSTASSGITFSNEGFEITKDGASITEVSGSKISISDSTAFTSKGIEIKTGELSVGTSSFNSTGAVTVDSGATFTQTGANADSTVQSVAGIVNNGSMTWDSTKAGGSLVISGNISGSNGEKVSFNYKNVTNSGDITLSGIFYNLTIASGTTVKNGSQIVVRNNLTVNGTYAHNSKPLILGQYTSGGTTFASGSDGIIGPDTATVNLGNTTISQNTTGKTFNAAVTFTTLSLDDTTSGAGGIVFNKDLTASSITNAFGTSFALAFNEDLSVTNAVTLNTNGAVVFGDASDDIQTFSAGLSIPSSSGVTLCGTLTSSGDVTITPAVTLGSDETVNAGTNSVTFGSTITGPDKKIDATAATVTFNGNVACASVSVTGKTNAVCSTITTSGTQSYSDEMTLGKDITISGSDITFGGGATGSSYDLTVTASGKTTLAASKTISVKNAVFNNTGILLLNASSSVSVSEDFKQQGSGTSQIAAAISSGSGTGKISFAKDAYINGASSFSAGGGVSFGENLYVFAGTAASPESVVFSSNTSVTNNLASFWGKLSFASGIGFNAGKDLILLSGSQSSMDDDSLTNESGVSGLFAYHNAMRTSSYFTASPSLSAYPTALPDGTAVSTDSSAVFATTVESLSGQIFTAGQNFYDNGVSLTGSASWNLKVPDNDNGLVSFAEAFNCSISNCIVCGITSTDGAWLSAGENCTDGSGNTRVDFGRPLIKTAKTVFDDVIFVQFVDSVDGTAKKIENSNNEINAAVQKIELHSSDGTKYYAAAFTDSDCTVSTDGQGDISEFYIRYGNGTSSDTKWNTDASGISAGDSGSSDRNGKNHGSGTTGTIPYLNLPKALSSLYSTFRDCHKTRIAHYYSASPSLASTIASANASAGATYTKVLDESAPVLVDVRAGQERHVAPNDASGQPEYDGHNFVEFIYSEPVNVGGITGKLSLPSDASSLTSTEQAASKNVQATSALGGITNNASGFTSAGLGTFAAGSIYSGKSGSDDDILVHSLYRIFDSTTAGSGSSKYQSQRIRLGIAAYVDNTAFSTTAGSINHWLGYIKSGEMPSGTVTRLQNDLITDASGNVLEYSATGHETNHPLGSLSVNSSLTAGAEGVFGAWDLSGPVFAPYNSKVTGSSDFYEAVGYTENASSAYLDRIEFHMADSASMMSSYTWYTKIGWTDGSGSTVVSAKDTAGGAKPFDPVQKSNGGIRYSSVYDKVSHFSYGVIGGSSGKNFTGNAVGKTSSALFLASSGGVSSVDDYDSNYFALMLSESNLTLKTTFEITYDGNGYITDLAGNLLLPGVNTTVKTIDRVAPNFNLSLASVKTDGGVNGDEVYVVFSKALQTGSFTIVNNDSTTEVKNGLESIPKSLRIVTISSDGSSVTASDDLKIDDTVSARIVFSSKDYTGLIIKLNRAVTLADMEKYYIQCYVGTTSIDPVSGTSTYVTYIQDVLGNYMVQNAAHALTDFAVGVVQPSYAYDSKLLDDGTSASSQLYKDGTWAVHDWGRKQGNYGSLTYGYDIYLSTKLNDGSSDGTSELPSYISLYMAPLSKISSNALSATYNKNIGGDWRMWLPSKSVDGTSWPVFNSLAQECNSNYGMFSLPVDTETPSVLNWKFTDLNFKDFLKTSVGASASDQLLFLFGFQSDAAGTPVTICHAPEYSESTGKYTINLMPLFAGRLENAGDLTSLDLWSLKLKSTTLQRGGVTILNNVINADEGEKTMIQVDMESEGSLNVIVMTLDGNIVQYLQHGTASSGTHYYTWNGTTKSGKKVARGLYFVRVFGNGIDETRKVMVVK